MPAARDAKAWAAAGGLHGIGNSLYTPVQWHRRRRHRLRRVPRARSLLRRRPRAPHALAHERDRRVVVAHHRRAQAAARGGGRGGARDRTRHRDPGVHERHVGQGLRRAHAARRGARRRHLLPADTADGGPRRRGRAPVLPVRRRPHRHRPRPVQLGVVRLRARPGRGRTDRERDPCGVRDEGRDDGTVAQQGRARAGSRARHLGVRHHRVQGGMAAAGDRQRRATRHRRLPATRRPRSRCSRPTGPWCGRAGSPKPSSTRWRRASTGSARSVGGLVHGLPRTARLLHALGRRVPLRGVRARPPRR